jgi:riboflavin kinase / FMN adenylyltransferase
MIVARHPSSLRSMGRPWVVALGSFDGVHVGHQAVLNRLVQVARDEDSAPLVLSLVDTPGPLLACLRQQLEQISTIGIDLVCLLRQHVRGGDEAAWWRAMKRDTTVRAAVVGAGTALDAVRIVAEYETRVDVVPMVDVDGDVVTSAGIRTLIGAGNLDQARRLLGRPYAVGGRIVHGQHRGRQLGFPTANLRVKGLQLPPNGVYAVRFRSTERVYHGVANLGFNPTFANQHRSLETHVFDFDGDLYGRYAEVTFVGYLRGERKFSGVEGLMEQIRLDCAEARRLLS